MREVEDMIDEALHPLSGCLGKMILQLRENSGKMLRPRLLIACAAMAGGGGRHGRDLAETAAAVELIHTASLLHDDIIDEAPRRRGGETLHMRWGCGRATQLGDLLLARAFALLSLSGKDRSLLMLMARSVSLLCRGEICQMDQQLCWLLDERRYYRINYFKTAQFISACCEGGARIAGAPAASRRALRIYGLKLGQAFQIADDIRDYTASPREEEKAAGNDLEQGRITLPLIHLLATRKQYLKLLQNLPPRYAPPPELRKILREAVKECGSLDYAAAAASQKKEEALKALQHFPPSPERRLLAGITRSMLP